MENVLYNSDGLQAHGATNDAVSGQYLNFGYLRDWGKVGVIHKLSTGAFFVSGGFCNGLCGGFRQLEMALSVTRRHRAGSMMAAC